jgi:hypothetical protein
MMAFFSVLIVSFLIFLYELPPLVKKKQYKESIVFGCLQLIGSFLILLFFLDVPLPNPLDWIIFAIKPLSNLFNSVLT